MGYIYLITNKINKKQYVGQTLCADIETRWKQHKKANKASLGRYLLAAYKKYGIENFNFKIICICFDEDCNRFEEEYIKSINTLSPNGYNLKAGGKNSKHHPDTLKKMSESLKGRAGNVMTPELRKKLSECHKGEKNGNFGKPMSEEQKNKIRQTILNKNNKEESNKNNKEELNKKISDGVKKWLEKNPNKINRKKVGKYDKEDKLIEVYKSTLEAGKENNIHHSVIGKVCRGVKSYKTAAGFVWKFL
jgi:group I intron endonuclease